MEVAVVGVLVAEFVLLLCYYGAFGSLITKGTGCMLFNVHLFETTDPPLYNDQLFETTDAPLDDEQLINT